MTGRLRPSDTRWPIRTVMGTVLAATLLTGCGTLTGRVAENAPGASSGAVTTVSATPSAVASALPALPSGVVSLVGTSDPQTAAEIGRYRAASGSVRTSYRGTSAGFEALCSGEADIVDSSTPIPADALAQCHAAGLDVVQLVLAADPVVVAIRNETDIGGDCLSTDQVRDLFRTGSPYSTWRQLGFDDVPVSVGGPSVDQGTYQAFATQVLGTLQPASGDVRFDYTDNVDDAGSRRWLSGRAGWQRSADQAEALQSALTQARSQLTEQKQQYEAARAQLGYASSGLAADQRVGAGTAQITADQRAVFDAQGRMTGAQVWIPQMRRQVAAARAAYQVAHRAQRELAALRGRVAILGFDYYQAHEDELRPMEISLPGARRNCIFPSEQAISDGQYPLADRTLLTTTTRSLGRGVVRDLLGAVLARARADASAAGRVPVDQATLDRERAWVEGTAEPSLVAASASASATAPAEVPAQ